MMKHSEEFKQEAVRIALTNGLSRLAITPDQSSERWGPESANSFSRAVYLSLEIYGRPRMPREFK